ncbi:MAG: histidine--tRNA ligase [Flavobacteriales bacterium]
MAQKPSTPKGTRDFSPVEMLRRKYIFGTIEKVFQKYGFLPLETPAMENLETLTGKYGEEGDRLIFKILNSGDAWGGVSEEVKKRLADGEEVSGGRLAAQLSEKALRYDLTVPFARYVVQHQNEITFPFKRYQIQPVWRADRPQKGRYREFYQCDADMIGSKSLLNEVDLLLVIREVFDAFGLKVELRLNNRKVLMGFADLFSIPDRLTEFVIILDKLDKVGKEQTLASYADAGFGRDLIDGVKEMIDTVDRHGGTFESHRDLERMFARGGAASGTLGVMELEEVLRGYDLATGGNAGEITVNFTLARGLDYYTGAIFEVKALEGTLQSSICGGGRYDDLTGVFGLKGMSGVGISFGADRIYDVLLETGKFPAELGASTRVLFANFGEAEAMHCLKLLRQVREAGIAAELYPDQVKMAKQFKYADDKGIPFVAIIGESEMKQGIITVKDMKTGEQKAVKQDELLDLVH